jgi:hypothetical protein
MEYGTVKNVRRGPIRIPYTVQVISDQSLREPLTQVLYLLMITEVLH